MSIIKIYTTGSTPGRSAFRDYLEEVLSAEEAVLDPEDAPALAESLEAQLWAKGTLQIIDESTDLVAVDFAEMEVRCVAHALDGFPEITPDHYLKLAALADLHDLDDLRNFSMEEMGELLQAFGKLKRMKPDAIEKVCEEAVDVLITTLMVLKKLANSPASKDLIKTMLDAKISGAFKKNFG